MCGRPILFDTENGRVGFVCQETGYDMAYVRYIVNETSGMMVITMWTCQCVNLCVDSDVLLN